MEGFLLLETCNMNYMTLNQIHKTGKARFDCLMFAISKLCHEPHIHTNHSHLKKAYTCKLVYSSVAYRQ